MTNSYQYHEEAVQKVREVLARPYSTDWDIPEDGLVFDPWDLFPSLYGSYSSDFDDMALEVLGQLVTRDLENWRQDLAAEMFREMLCTADLCQYGTSPRVCFPTKEFEAVLPDLIAKWKAYYKIQWGSDEDPAATSSR